MDQFELNKVAAGILIALLTAMVGGIIADALIPFERLKQNAYKVEGVSAAPVDAKTAVLEPISGLLATANLENGKSIVDKKCAQCHTVSQGGPHKIGPNLWNIVGGAFAHAADFPYSSGLKSKEGHWDYESLNHLIYKPRELIPGTKMSFGGLPKTQDRADVVAYLRTLSDAPKPLPEAKKKP